MYLYPRPNLLRFQQGIALGTYQVLLVLPAGGLGQFLCHPFIA